MSFPTFAGNFIQTADWRVPTDKQWQEITDISARFEVQYELKTSEQTRILLTVQREITAVPESINNLKIDREIQREWSVNRDQTDFIYRRIDFNKKSHFLVDWRQGIYTRRLVLSLPLEAVNQHRETIDRIISNIELAE